MSFQKRLIFLCRYDPGGGLPGVQFIYKVPVSFSEQDKITMGMRMLKKIQPEIPIFHTRAVRQKFQKKVTLIGSSNITPHMLRHIYHTLSGNTQTKIMHFCLLFFYFTYLK